MTHGLVTRRHVLALISLCSLTLSWRARAADDELVRLFSELGTRRERQARFTERKFSALLKAPVESSGTLVFRAPDLLEKRTIAPQRESVRIEGNVVTYEGALGGHAQKRTFALSDAPLLAALIESLRATLAGDLPALRRHYDVSWSAPQSQKGWQLTLAPREQALRDAVAKVVMRGAGSEVSTVEIVEASGDFTLMQITPLVVPTKK
jgi:Outer membrane lipoprotein carrier protein LolA-like